MEAKILALKSSRPDIEITMTGKITRPPARDRASISSSNKPPPLR
jgi:hypothetical protein